MKGDEPVPGTKRVAFRTFDMNLDADGTGTEGKVVLGR